MTTYHLTCSHCSKPFTTHHKHQQTCGRSCGSIVLHIKRGTPPWTEAEDEVLYELSGTHLVDHILRKVNKVNERNGQPPRTQSAVCNRMSILGLSRAATEDNFSCSELARQLGISFRRLMSWRTVHGLRFKKLRKKRHALTLSMFREWASGHHELLAGIEYEPLLWALDNPALAKQLSQMPTPKIPRAPIAVRRLDNGHVYPTIRQAADALFVEHSTLAKALRSGRNYCGGVQVERAN